MEPKEDRRSLTRFRLRLPSLVTPRGAKEPLSLFTENVSAGGAFFSCGGSLPVKTRVEVGMLLPLREQGGAKTSTHIQVTGEVIRAEARGMAVRFDPGYRLTRLPD